MVHYEKTVELKTLLRGWFKVMDTLLKQCNKKNSRDQKNFLVKTLISQAWGTLSKYRKIYVKKETCKEYDWEHLKDINNTDRYEYYCKDYENGVFTMVEAKNAYTHGGIARIKPFLTEFARGFVFNMLSEHDLAKDTIRAHTDGICFRRAVDFKALNLDYFPTPEAKSTGTLEFYNVNCYYHVCSECSEEYAYDKDHPHKCSC